MSLNGLTFDGEVSSEHPEDVHPHPPEGYFVLLDKDQRTYRRSSDGDAIETERDNLNAKYPHMGFKVEWHKYETIDTR